MKRHIVLVACMFAGVCLMLLAKTLGSGSVGGSQAVASGSAGAATHVVVQSSGRGRPFVNFEDGIELSGTYTGATEMQSVLKQNAVEPRALASADFDEDGVQDLVCGFGSPRGGIITLYRGNVDSIYPNSLEAQQRKAKGGFTESALLSPARAFETSVAAGFVGAGDFDADGHWDLVIGNEGVTAVYLMAGDGKGSFLAPRKISLPGAVTSLVTGEINRADGLTDIVVGVVADDGPKVLVFEGPDGALRAKPETFLVPGRPRALALGQFDDDYPIDLAIGAGYTLVTVNGRDRRLSLYEIRQSEVLPAHLERRSVGFEIRCIAAGDFTGEHETGLALLSSDGTAYLMGNRDLRMGQRVKKRYSSENR